MFAQLEYTHDGGVDLVLYRNEEHATKYNEDPAHCDEFELLIIVLNPEQLTELVLRREVKPVRMERR